jgi:nicotinate-nucleotide adenylyltransferase
MMKIGLMGGTFDPIHLGHLRAAENAREALALDRVAFLPSGAPPHRAGPLSPALDRYAMVCLATAAHPQFLAWDTEVRRPGPSYTVDTVLALLDERPGDAFVMIVGSDTYPEMATWREPERLFGLCAVAVVDRPGEESAVAPPPFPAAKGVARVSGPGLCISATVIRERVRHGESVRYLVPDAVSDYISKRGLYVETEPDVEQHSPPPHVGRDRVGGR